MGSSFAFHVVVVVVVVAAAAAGVVVVVVVLGAAALFSLKAFHGPHYEYTTKVRQPIPYSKKYTNNISAYKNHSYTILCQQHRLFLSPPNCRKKRKLFRN